MNSMSYCPALIDEWQLVPEVWDVGRRQVDRDVRHLLWLQELLGPDLLDAAVLTTGAGAGWALSPYRLLWNGESSGGARHPLLQLIRTIE